MRSKGTPRALLATCALVLGVGVGMPATAGAQTGDDAPETDAPETDVPAEPPIEDVDPHLDATVETAVADMVKLGEWIEAYSRAKWYEGINAAAAERAAQAAPTGGYHPGTTVGECTGFAIPDYIIQRESGGNPSAYNPSGAYGCAQTLLSHYSRGSCQGLDPYQIDGQRECVNRLSNGGTNLAPWAATR